MVRILAIFLLAVAALCAVLVAPRPGRQADGSYVIPTGQVLTPAGDAIEVSDRPLGMTVSPDGETLAVVTGSNFAPRSLHLIDAAARRVRQTLPLGDSFAGVAFFDEGRRLAVGGGQTHEIRFFRREGETWVGDGAVMVAGGAPSGLAVEGATLVAALNQKHAVALVDLATRQVRTLDVGSYPYTVVAHGGVAYVSNWGGRRPRAGDKTDGVFPVVVDPRTGIPASGTVSVVDVAKGQVTAEIETGLHPSGMALDGRRARLYVANANSDSISVIDVRAGRVEATWQARITPKAPLGSAPNALCLSADGGTLYAANGADNAVAVIDTASGAVRGFIPTGWYPTAVALSGDGRRLFAASGYGFGSIAPTKDGKSGRSYTDRRGVVSAIELPNRNQLAAWTRAVRRNDTGLLRQGFRGRAAPIRHVFYIIKENRTYDQVFGDMKQGNGDESLVHFGREVTPNHHKLAEEFVLLDNYYTPADQSALGHRWCTQGYASDWVHKYGNGRNDQNPMLFAPNDFLWDAAKVHGLAVRAYGERGLNTIAPKGATWSDVYGDWKNGTRRVTITPRAQIVGLRDIYAPTYPAYGLVVPDQYRADRFLEEFAEFQKNGNLPRLVVLLLPQDHTSGTAPGFPTPRAMVADNDLALGRVVEAISKSRYWADSIIFVTEDDAQSGLDHVDGHRTVGLVIGPWVKRRVVDSNFYTTIHIYRTIEHLLGLPPQNQFDLAAEPMFPVFAERRDTTPYTAEKNRIPLDEMNPALGALKGDELARARASMKMDFSEPDVAPEAELDRVIWHSVKGARAPYPKLSRRQAPGLH